MARYRDIDSSVMRLWDESKHPRDYKGRFTFKGGNRLLKMDVFGGRDEDELAKLLKDLKAIEDEGKKKIAYHEKLKDMGTAGWWADNLENTPYPNLLMSGVQDAHGVGAKLPRYIAADRANLFGGLVSESTVGFYDPVSKAVHFNPKHEMWEAPEEFSGLQHRLGFWSTPNPRGVISHEIAHSAHEHNLENDPRKHRKYGAAVPPSVYDHVAAEVSLYGLGSVNEMIAEMFAGARHGETYPPELWEVYNHYGGPQVGGLLTNG